MTAEILTNYIISGAEWNKLIPINIYIKVIKVKITPEHFIEMYPDVKLPFEVVVRLYSPISNNCVQSKNVKLTTIEDEIIFTEIDPIKLVLNDLRYIRMKQLIMGLYKLDIKNKLLCFGQCARLLNDAKENEVNSGKSVLQTSTRVMSEVYSEYKFGS